MKSPLFPVAARDGAKAGQRVLTLGGPLDMASVPDFLRAVREETAPVIIIDFSKVSFIDSTGVGALIQLLPAFQRGWRKLALTSVGHRVMAVMELTRVKTLFSIFSSLTDAEQSLS